MKQGVGSERTAKETGVRNMAQTLFLAQRLGGWVTPDLAARWVWPLAHPTASRKTVSELLQRAVERRLLLARWLGGRRVLYVVTRTGARWWGGLDGGDPGLTGTGLGQFEDGTWVPPATLTHDMRAARFQVYLATQHWQFVTGHELARANPDAAKLPDGLAFKDRGSKCFWIEVEGARKSGPAMRHMAAELVAVQHGIGPTLRQEFGMLRATATMIVLPPPMPGLNHRLRIESAVSRQNPVKDVQLNFYTEVQPWVWERAQTIVPAVVPW